MSERRPHAEFNIGSQQGNISNVAGDMTVQGDQRYVAAPTDAARQDLARLRLALLTIDIDPKTQRLVEDLMTEANDELDQTRPDIEKVARPIERLTSLLKDAGALAAAGAALIDPLRGIASWLGASGRAILQMLGAT